MFTKKKREKRMTTKGGNRERVLLFSMSAGAYILAYLYLLLCSEIPEDAAAWGFMLLTFVGAVCAYIYGTLPAPELSPECLEELEKMIEDMKNDR